MAAVFDPRVLLGRALLASLALHALVAFFVPALAWTASTAQPVETLSFVHLAPVEITPPRPPQPPPQAIAKHHSLTPIVTLATHHLLAHVSSHASAPTPATTSRDRSTAVNVAPVTQAGERDGAGTAAPQVTPSPIARAVATASTHETGGYLPFGAEQPVPVLDPGILKQLASLGVHVTLVVTVGEDGRTKNVAFDPPVDPAIQARIESLLADASWDPAVCGGGISCEAQATIRL